MDDQERIEVLDSNGTKIADSDPKHITSLSKNTIGDVSFRNLQSFSNAVKGGTGLIEEMLNGSSTLVLYIPVKAIQNN